MTTRQAFQFMLTFKKEIVAERLDIDVEVVRYLKWRMLHNRITESDMMGFLVRFGFPIEQQIVWGMPSADKNKKWSKEDTILKHQI